MSSKSTSKALTAARSVPTFNQQLISDGVKPLRCQLSGEGEDAAIRWLAQSIQKHTQLVPIVADGKKVRRCSFTTDSIEKIHREIFWSRCTYLWPRTKSLSLNSRESRVGVMTH